MIREIQSDIFEAPIDCLIHQANCQCTMGGGIAKVIRDRYPEVYERDCQTEKGDINKLGTFSIAKIKDPNSRIKHVINLYSQFEYGNDKRYTDYTAMVDGLELIRDGMIAKGTNETITIGIPYKMGCLRGGGDWSIVEAIIYSVFSDEYDFKILICRKD